MHTNTRVQRRRARFLIGATIAAVSAHAATAQTARPEESAAAAAKLDTVQVTATRFGEPVQEVPGSISVVTGEEIRDRGATDLRTALALLSGVSVSPVSDAGPAGSVPNLLGIREIDDLLLLIDGVPAGGAFSPRVEAISLNNVERIEVIRGAAPVYFGTTAFAGTLNVIHYPAGRAEDAVRIRYGSYGTIGANGSAVLSTGDWRQSIAAEVGDDRWSDAKARSRRAEATYRAGTTLAGGDFRADLGALTLHQKPVSPSLLDPVLGRLTSLLPDDFNQNPSNAKIDTDRYQLVLAYDRPLSFGQWGNTLSVTDTTTSSIRGFIDAGDTPAPFTARTVADLEAFRQSMHQHDLFFDSHLTASPLAGLDVTTGVNALLGRADAASRRYNFKLPLDGTVLPAIDAGVARGTVDLDDHRRFIGLYGQSRYRLTPDASLLAGVRWNRTHETYDSTAVNSRNVVTRIDTSQENSRFSGSVGGQWRVLHAPAGPIDGVTLQASVGNTFQPSQIDFSPNPEARAEGGGLLKPETQRSIVVGMRADALGGRADFDIDLFYVDFHNQPITTTAGGVSVLRAVGRQRYKGVDIDGSFSPAPNWSLKANATLSSARFLDFVTDVDGAPTQLSGRRQVLTPAMRTGGGILYAPAAGLRGSFTTTYIGPRYLDPANRYRVGGFTVLDASAGYRFDRYTFTLSASNLTDRRDPILASELGEGEFYRMTSRRIEGSLRMSFR